MNTHMTMANLRNTAGAVLLVSLLLPAISGAQDSTKIDPSNLMPPPPAVSLAVLRTGVDSVTASPGESYSAWWLHRFIYGDLNRDLWSIPIRVPVLDLKKVGGGLTVLELSGGKQTLGIQFTGNDGVTYQFRSLVKEPRRPMPKVLHQLPPGRVSKDQMAAQFPLAPLVVAELVEAVGVLVAKPRLVVMPDDERLGEFREAFAGRMGWIEVRPEEGKDDSPGFAGSTKISGTYDVYAELIENPRSYVNADALLRARLVDFLVGDWDRHSDQWRWARFKDGDRMRWDPIPRDRDWAFAHIDGVLRPLVSLYYPQYVNFAPDYLDVYGLTWASQRVDRLLLAGLDSSAFMKIANEVSATLTDAVLAKSVATLPLSYREAGNELLGAMRNRRNKLVDAAAEFYALIAREPAILATDKADSVTISADDKTVRVQIHEGEAGGMLRYDRTFRSGESRELRLYLLDGADRVIVKGSSDLPIVVRIATGGGDDRIVDSTSGKNVRIYNTDGDDNADLGRRAFFTEHDYLAQDTIRTAARVWNIRDWGSAWLLLPSADHQSDIGLLMGAKITRNSFGFGQQPCHTCISAEVLSSFTGKQIITTLGVDRLITSGGLWIANSLEMQSGRPTRFYGFGNDVPTPPGELSFTGFRSTFELKSGFRHEVSDNWNLFAGATWRRFGSIREGGDTFDDITYGGGHFQQVGLKGEFELDTRDVKGLPTKGAVAELSADYHPALLDVASPYSSVRGSVRLFQSLPLPLDPALHLRLVGAKVWGTAPFADVPYLGGSSTLPGFARSQFRGNAMASAYVLLRAKALSVFKLDLGVHGLSGIGRVWEDGEESSTWHRSSGAGMWLHLPSVKKTISVTFVKGEQKRTYFDFGFIF